MKKLKKNKALNHFLNPLLFWCLIYAVKSSNGAKPMEKYRPPEIWTEHWDDHNDTLFLVYSNDHIALYFDQVNYSEYKWPTTIMSDAWSYAKTTFGPFDPDPILYIVIHKGFEPPKFSKTRSYVDTQFDNRKVIDVGENVFTTQDGINTSKQTVLLSVARTVLTVVRNTGNWPAWEICEWAMPGILVYDMYIGLKFDIHADYFIYAWTNFKVQKTGIEAFWIRDWFYPIYKTYGGTSVLNKFFSLVNNHFPRGPIDYERSMSLGEFVHFWSGAAGEDLTYLAVPAFNWKDITDEFELIKARGDFPEINYTDPFSTDKWFNPQGARKEYWNNHTEDLTLVYYNKDIVFYFDKDVNQSLHWPFGFVWKGWKHVKEKYRSMGPDPILYVVLHGKKHPGCTPEWRGGYPTHGYLNLIDCGPVSDSDTNWNDNVLNAYVLIGELSSIILRKGSNKGFWTNSNESAPMQDLITINLLYSLGQSDADMNWLKENLKSRTFVRYLSSEALLLRKWYIDIYNHYGGNKVLSKFAYLIYFHWPGPLSSRTSMLLGEIVHFWSAAAGVNLWYSAVQAFPWTLHDHKKFFETRENFKLKKNQYPDTYPGTKSPIPTLKWKATRTHDQSTPDNEEYTLVYIDAYVAFYFDERVDKTIQWPFTPISKCWRHAQETYGPFGPDPILYIVLLEFQKGNKKDYSRKFKFSIDADYINRTILNPVLSLTEWKDPSYLFVLVEAVVEAVVWGPIEAKNWPIRHSQFKMKNIILFDLYMGIGLTKSAVVELLVNQYHDKWLMDWYFTVYVKYGRTQALNRFFSLLHAYWPTSSEVQMNYGEFVHFWSGAAGTNLKYMIPEFFKWNKESEVQYQNATVKFPMIKYNEAEPAEKDVTTHLLLTENWLEHSETVFLAYKDSFIITYFDADFPQNTTWPFKLLSQSWNYLQKSYDPIPETSDSSLLAIFHSNKQTACQTMWNFSSLIVRNTIMDCGQSSDKVWATESTDSVDYFMQGFSNIVLQSANQTQTNLPDSYYTTSLKNVISFDIYLSTGKIEPAYHFLSTKVNEKEKQSAGEINWIREWLIPIYTTGGGVTAINSYLSLTLKYHSVGKELNIGQILHFWNAAVGENLLRLANSAFGWTESYQKQFDYARKQLPELKYSDYDYSLKEKVEEDTVLLEVLIPIGVAVLIVLAILYLLHRRRITLLQEQIRELTADETLEFFEGNSNADHVQGNALISSRPMNMKFEILREQLDIYYDRVLGSGAFGLVVRGSITTTIDEEIRVTTVAVKTSKSNTNVAFFKTLLAELKVLCYLDNKNEHVAHLMGAVTTNIKKREIFIALEYCEHGDLKSYLKKHRENFQDMFHSVKESTRKTSLDETIDINYASVGHSSSNSRSSSIPLGTQSNFGTCLSSMDLLEWARQISSGMSFISSQNVIHGDLACRNVLLTLDNVAKISDFGLSRQLANYSYYKKRSNTPLPWKWLAIECLKEKHFTIQSDVWAFGVTLYEIFSLGQTPYAGCDWNRNFVNRLVAGERLSSPVHGNKEVYQIMMDCMKTNPEDRIAFAEITTKFQNMKREMRPESESDSDCIYADLEC